jgi:hypothetical protein
MRAPDASAFARLGLGLQRGARVIGVGSQVGFLFPVGDIQGYLNLKGYGEFDAANRPAGWNTLVDVRRSSPWCESQCKTRNAHGNLHAGFTLYCTDSGCRAIVRFEPLNSTLAPDAQGNIRWLSATIRPMLGARLQLLGIPTCTPGGGCWESASVGSKSTSIVCRPCQFPKTMHGHDRSLSTGPPWLANQGDAQSGGCLLAFYTGRNDRLPMRIRTSGWETLHRRDRRPDQARFIGTTASQSFNRRG